MSAAAADGLVLPMHRHTFRAFAMAVVPEMDALDDTGWQEVERTVEHALAQRPPKVRRQVGLLLGVIETLPRVRYGRSFSALDGSRRTAVIDMLQRAPVQLVRRGVWGLRTLVLMGCYTRPQTMHDVGYRASARGWAARATEST